MSSKIHYVCKECLEEALRAENVSYFEELDNECTAFGRCEWCGKTSSERRKALVSKEGANNE